MTDPPTPRAPDAAILAPIVARLAAELEAAAETAAALDAALAPGSADAKAGTHRKAAALQELDRLRQLCADLACFQRRLATALDAGAPLSGPALAEGLQLRQVADRLAGRAAAAEHGAQETGQVEIF